MSKKLKLAYLLMMLAVIGCGKKAGTVDKKTSSEIAPLDAEVDFKNRRDFKTAIKNNDLELLAKVLKNQPDLDINEPLDDGNTPIIEAIQNSGTAVRNFLIEKKADLNKANVSQETPLMAAVLAGSINSVKVLLDHRVQIDKTNAQGQTALHLAIKLQDDKDINASKRKAAEINALALLRAGASIDILDHENRNAYQLLQEYPNDRIMELVKSIIDVAQGTPDIASFRTVLLNGDIKNLNLMFLKAKSIAQTYEYINPLVIAQDNRDPISSEIVMRMLLKNNANPDGPENAEITPLIKSVLKHNLGFTILLLEQNADPNLKDRKGRSALYHAIEMVEDDSVQYLINKNAEKSYRVQTKDGWLNFKACTLAKNVEKDLTLQEDIQSMNKIKKSLNCGSSWLSLQSEDRNK